MRNVRSSQYITAYSGLHNIFLRFFSYICNAVSNHATRCCSFFLQKILSTSNSSCYSAINQTYAVAQLSTLLQCSFGNFSKKSSLLQIKNSVMGSILINFCSQECDFRVECVRNTGPPSFTALLDFSDRSERKQCTIRLVLRPWYSILFIGNHMRKFPIFQWMH